MKTATILAALVMAASCASAAPKVSKTGGEIIKRGTFTGKVAFVNTQEKVADSNVCAIAKLFARMTDMNFVSMRLPAGKPEEILAKSGAEVAVILADDPAAPTLLVAPEDHWAVLNVAKLTDDLPSAKAKERFFVPRARKMLIKAASLACGGGSSQFPDNIMNVSKVRELDFIKEKLPADMVDHYIKYLGTLGVRPKEMTTYRAACREGWAPPPTNDVQKAIWDKAHEIPTNPIKIEFDPKKEK